MKARRLITLLSRALLRALRSGSKSIRIGFFAFFFAFSTCLSANIALAGPITYIQGHYEASVLSRAKMTVVYTDAQKAGDLNVVIVGWRDPDSLERVFSVTDSVGNHYPGTNGYASAIGPVTSDNGIGILSESIYFCPSILAAGPRANTVTVRFLGNAASPDIRILEYSGIAPFPIFPAIASSGNSAWSRSGNLTISTIPTLMVAANMSGPLTSEPTSGFTQRLLTKPYGDIAEDRVVSAFTSNNRYNAGASLTQAGPWLMLMVSFQGATATTAPIAPSPSTTAPTPAS